MTDLTDAERAVIAPLMPAPAPCRPTRLDNARDPERHLLRIERRHRVAADPEGPAATFDYFSRWRDEGLFARINHDTDSQVILGSYQAHWISPRFLHGDLHVYGYSQGSIPPLSNKTRRRRRLLEVAACDVGGDHDEDGGRPFAPPPVR